MRSSDIAHQAHARFIAAPAIRLKELFYGHSERLCNFFTCNERILRKVHAPDVANIWGHSKPMQRPYGLQAPEYADP